MYNRSRRLKRCKNVVAFINNMLRYMLMLNYIVAFFVILLYSISNPYFSMLLNHILHPYGKFACKVYTFFSKGNYARARA